MISMESLRELCVCIHLMYLRHSRWDIVHMYELDVNQSEILHLANTPLNYDLSLTYLAFGIIVGDPGGCHVTLKLGA